MDNDEGLESSVCNQHRSRPMHLTEQNESLDCIHIKY